MIRAILAALGIWVFGTLSLEVATAAETSQPPRDSQPYANTRNALAQAIPKLMRQNRIAGLSIALVDDQAVVWAQGFGYADKAKKIKAAPETIYRAGSISKLFTATAAMQLVEQGKFDIDRPLQTYLPGFSIKTRFPDAGAITPRQLMTHHSGLPGDYLKGEETAVPPEPFGELVNKLPDEYVAYPPNFILSYSNLGVSLLGYTVETLCATSFGDCLETSLLKPLEMADSGFSSGPSASPLMSKGYSQGLAVPQPYLRDVPAGGLNTTVFDLGRFMRMLFADGFLDGRQLISSAALSEMLRPQNADIPLDLDQQIGLGWFLNHTTRGETMAWHNGGIGSFHGFLATLPEHKLGVVVLANSDTAAGVVDELGSNTLESMLSEKSGGPGPVASFHAATPTPLSLPDFPGYYASGNFGLIGISKKYGRMRIQLNGRSYPIKPHTDGSVGFRFPQLGAVTLRRAKLSEREVLTIEGPQERQLLGEKIPQTPLPMIWRHRAGKYRVLDEDNVVLRLGIQNGFLVLSGFGPNRVLTPVSDTEAIIAGLGRSLGETIAIENRDGVEVLRYSGYLAKRK